MTHAKQQLAKLEYNAREALGLQQEQARPPVPEGEHLQAVLGARQEVRSGVCGGEELYQYIHHQVVGTHSLWTVLWLRDTSLPRERIVRVTCTAEEELVQRLRLGAEAAAPLSLTQWDGSIDVVVEAGGEVPLELFSVGQRLGHWRVEALVRSPQCLTVEVRAEGEPNTVMVDVRPTGEVPGGLQGPSLSFNYRGRGALMHPAEWAMDVVVNSTCTDPERAATIAARLCVPDWEAEALPSQSDAGPSSLLDSEILPQHSLDLGQPPCGLSCGFCDGHLAHSSRTADPLKQLEQLADDGVENVLLADGEPLHYPGVAEVVQKATMLGIKTVLHTSGPPLARQGVVDSLAQAGLDVLHLSVYHTEEAVHDAMVGMPGAWEQTMQGIESARSAGIAVRPGTIVMRNNVDIMKELVELLAQASGFPGVKVRWVRAPAWDQARYQHLTPRLDHGLATLVEQFGPALLWRSLLLWWTVPCAAQATGFGESPLWHLGDRLEHNYVLEPQQRLGVCPHAEECAYNCSLYQLYAGLAEPGLQPVMDAAIRPLDTFGGVAEWTLVFAPTHRPFP